MILLDKALQYCNDVIEGKEITTWEAKRQCEIFLEDYNINQYKEDYPYYADEKELLKINNILKLFNFATGFVEGKQVLENLASFQCFLLCGVFLFRFKDKPYKYKNNDNTLFIARKNSKTAIIGIIFLLLMLTSQQYSEFYSICLTKELAAEIKKIMEQIINASPLIKKRFKVSTTKTGSIKCLLNGCYFEPRVSEAGKNNAIRSEAFVSDEHANFSENSNFMAMKSGQKNVMNGLVFRTSTAYAINESIMEEDLDYIRKVLNGVITDERQFALIYYATEEHLWDDIGIYMANPLRIPENYETMRKEREVAKEKPSAREEYLTKTMNIFMQENKDEAYMDINLWKKCRVDKIDFSGKEVIVSLDGSITGDLTSVSICYRDGNKYYGKSHGFLPEGTMAERREKIDYYKYERLGYCTIQKSNTIQQHEIEEYIRSIEKTYDCKIKTIVADRFNFDLVLENLGVDYDVVKLIQSFNNLTVATNGLKEVVYNGNFYYEKNELLDWCVSNAILNVGKVEHVMLAKDKAYKSKKRIDLLATIVFCMTELYTEEVPYDAVKALDNMDW